MLLPLTFAAGDGWDSQGLRSLMLCVEQERELEELSSTDCQGYTTGGSMESCRNLSSGCAFPKKPLCVPKAATCCLPRLKGTAVSSIELISSPQAVLAPRADVKDRAARMGHAQSSCCQKNFSGNKGDA